LSANFKNDNICYAANHCYFQAIKDLKLPDPNINIKTSATEYGHFVYISTDKLAKNVCIGIDEEGRFSDNYFDLLPGDSVRIRFIGPHDVISLSDNRIKDFSERIRVISLKDTYQ